jgi:glycosyltransferase involved in cell wall biosynthesis/2-polyprenyl-3-methyl-5-hydroxy-6-metoxy-1,4-benzoquinol methylase
MPSGTNRRRPRLLVFIVAYNAERTIQRVLKRIPARLLDDYELEALVIDDGSADGTFERAEEVRRSHALPFPVTVLFNPVNQGYGGNQKIGFHYAIAHRFDVVALLHGDGRYDPERLPDLVGPIAAGQADAVLGSRMLAKAAARRGMPLYKYLGNRVLTSLQNRLLGAGLSEFHSGYRAYSTAALQRIPFHLDHTGFRFDTQIVIQLLIAALRIEEVPIPVYHGDEIRLLNGIVHARGVLVDCLEARAQQWSLFYDRKYDCLPAPTTHAHYKPRLGFVSTHTMAAERIPRGSRVLDLGCAGGYLGEVLRERGCHTTGIDVAPPGADTALDAFEIHDLNESPFPVDLGRFDCAVMLDVIEHLASPERFVDDFLAAAARNPGIRLVASTGNVAFLPVRFMLLLGQFNHGKWGILDLTHTRLFTVGAFRRLFEQSGFDVREMRGIPAPFPLALGPGRLAGLLLWLNAALIRVSRSLFAYQILAVVQPRPTLASLLARAQTESGARSAALDQPQLKS